ncbi:Hypothetical predicted protein, partial [Scomber scombrus]
MDPQEEARYLTHWRKLTRRPAQVDVTGEEQETTRSAEEQTSGVEEERGAHEHQREDQAANQAGGE